MTALGRGFALEQPCRAADLLPNGVPPLEAGGDAVTGKVKLA